MRSINEDFGRKVVTTQESANLSTSDSNIWRTVRDSLDDDSEGVASHPSQGIVYTRPRLVATCLNIAEKAAGSSIADIKILDVGCGFGQFVASIGHRMVAEFQERGLSFEHSESLLRERLRGVEIRPSTGGMARSALRRAVDGVYGKFLSEESLEDIVQVEDFLEWEADLEQFDVIVGNLPYVRYDKIDDLPLGLRIEGLRERFACFRGRADYSIPFLERISDSVGDDRIAVVITSNRYTRAEYGRQMRQHIIDRNIEVHEIDLGGIAAFEEEVSAYPSVFLFRSHTGSTSVYVRLHSSTPAALGELSEMFPVIGSDTEYLSVTQRDIQAKGAIPWSTLPFKATQLLRRLCTTCASLGELGATVRKGPATGANEVFIGPAEEFPFSDRSKRTHLIPLFTWNSKNGKRQSLLNLYEFGTGQLMELDEIPEDVQAYLNKYRERLKQRHIVEERGGAWWRMIDKFDPALQNVEKVLIPDCRPSSDVVYDRGEYLPGHSSVYVSGVAADVLQGLYYVLRSTIAEAFRFWRSPDLGRTSPRASSRMLRELPIPRKEELIKLGEGGFEEEAVLNAYNVNGVELELFR